MSCSPRPLCLERAWRPVGARVCGRNVMRAGDDQRAVNSCSQESMTCKWGSCCEGFKCRSEKYEVISIDKGKSAAAYLVSLPFNSCSGTSRESLSRKTKEKETQPFIPS